MDLRTLNYFLTVAEELNITRAANKLNISQPPLSRQLALLEDELGVQLFIRGKRQIQLTEEGKYLAQQAEDILNMADQTRQQLAMMSNQEIKGTLTMGLTETCSASILPDILPKFQKMYPKVNYNIWSGSSDEVAAHVEQGTIDIGIIRAPFNQQMFKSVFLKSEHWNAIVNKNHPLASTESISLEELSHEQLFVSSRGPLQQLVKEWFLEIGMKYHVIGLYNQISSILPLVSKGVGVAIGPESVKRYTDDRRLAYLTIEGAKQRSDLYIICRQGKQLPASARAFWNFITDESSHRQPSSPYGHHQLPDTDN